MSNFVPLLTAAGALACILAPASVASVAPTKGFDPDTESDIEHTLITLYSGGSHYIEAPVSTVMAALDPSFVMPTAPTPPVVPTASTGGDAGSATDQPAS